MSRFALLVLSLLALILAFGVEPSSLPAQQAAESPRALRVGTVDFISGPDEGRCGCPTVMNRNRKEQMVLVLTTDANESLGKLLSGIQDKTVDGGSVKGHVVFLPAKNHRDEQDQAAIVERLRAFSQAHSTERFTFGVRRASKAQVYKAQDIDPAVAHSVHLFINGEEVRQWQFERDAITDDTARIITRTANSLFEDRFASDGK